MIKVGAFVKLNGGPVYQPYFAWGYANGLYKMPNPPKVMKAFHIFKVLAIAPPLDDFWGKVAVRDGSTTLSGVESMDSGYQFVVNLSGLRLAEKTDKEDHTGMTYNPYKDSWSFI